MANALNRLKEVSSLELGDSYSNLDWQPEKTSNQSSDTKKNLQEDRTYTVLSRRQC
jgi:hypothetical protein